MTLAEELRHLLGEADRDRVPDGFQLHPLSYRGGAAALERAREVMTAVLEQRPLPEWFSGQCLDDSAVQTCTLDRWSLRAWKFWLEPENRRWWWWAAEAVGDEVRFTALVRSLPYLRGSIDWLFKASAAAENASPA